MNQQGNPTNESTRFGIATEWVGRCAALVSVILFVLVMMAIHKGLTVQGSSRTVVENFRTTNDFFADRADLTAPAKARQQLDELTGILAALNSSGATAVNSLGALLPDAATLVTAGQGDSRIAAQLETVAATLQNSAASLNRISTEANTTVTDVDSALSDALVLVDALNSELARTTDKLALVPETAPYIPAPEGIR